MRRQKAGDAMNSGNFRKKAVLWVMVLAVCFCFPVPLRAKEQAPSPEPDWTSLFAELDTQKLDGFQQQMREELGLEESKRTTAEWLWDFVKGDWNADGAGLFSHLKSRFLYVLQDNRRLLGKLLLLSAVSSLLVQLQSALNGRVAKAAALSCHITLGMMAMFSFQEAWNLGENAIERMVDFMNAMLPQMLVITSGLGNLTGSALLFPLLMTTTTTVANSIKTIVLPLTLSATVLHILNQLTEGIRVEKLAKFLTQAAQLSLGFMITAFVGFITVRTMYASALDKVVLRTGKFVTDHTIPVVGKMLSDTIEVAAGYVVVLKNALGIYGALMILGILALPLLQMIVMAALYRIAGALAEPLGDRRTAALLEKIGGSLWLLTAALASVSLVFLMMLALIVGLTNNLTL